ncbi:hypothetical protein GCM10023091_17660 [Ravibacter arvi]|uniref:Phosphoribosylanthranilate isomerase n=1 Tax=Ravibacter arvi TaxID=2051041 RepID=A0ABP8LYH2_9BACT
MLSTIVKISNVTNLSDARYCAGMGVEMLGFTIDKDHAQFVAPEKFKEIRSWVSGVTLVGETQSDDAEQILALLEQYPVDALEVSVPGLIPFLVSSIQIPLLLRIDVDHTEADGLPSLVRQFGGSTSYLLLESTRNAPMTASWISALKSLPPGSPVLLGFGLDDDEQIPGYLDTLPVAGIALRGSEELRPGFKDYGRMMDILELLETE